MQLGNEYVLLDYIHHRSARTRDNHCFPGAVALLLEIFQYLGLFGGPEALVEVDVLADTVDLHLFESNPLRHC